jgi:hypothetical protein
MIRKGKEVLSGHRKQNVLNELRGRMLWYGMREAGADHTEICRAYLGH